MLRFKILFLFDPSESVARGGADYIGRIPEALRVQVELDKMTGPV
jgi:hypothetical protein